jgi:hypothetical protein
VTHIGRRINKQIPIGQPENNGTASPIVAGICTATNIATATQRRNSNTGTRSKHNQFPFKIRSKGLFPHLKFMFWQFYANSED